ncbi:hypothetical protein [Hyalangium sp.]|uniref:hypothetical protein n=1 Tax=Hyalangium sp. TaxID=2028555 RepID=UPI002D6E1F8B|nr:hypothetical protein [Hyalangium sp.]HYH95699.1 hypothetical protein [Hyalangium sp.]
MNEWGHLEHKNEGQQKIERRDPKADEQKRITKGLDDREQVERTADRIRDELLLTLEELDRRRDRALDVRFQVSRHQDLIIAAAITAAVLTGIGVGVAMWRARHREQILTKQRLKAIRRAWAHPDRVASSAEQRPLPIELGRKLIMIFGTALASNIAKNSVQALVPRLRTQPAKG